MKRIKRRKSTPQIYCHICHEWIQSKSIKVIETIKDERFDLPVLHFKCICGGEDRGLVYSRRLEEK